MQQFIISWTIICKHFNVALFTYLMYKYVYNYFVRLGSADQFPAVTSRNAIARPDHESQ